MKTHYLILAMLMLLGISCSSDDESSTPTPEPPIPIESRYLSKITNENDEEIMSFSYNADKTIKTISRGTMQFRYEYENGNISRIYFTVEGGTVFTDFEYTNGILSSYTQEGEVHPVDYEAETNSYSFAEGGYIYQLYFTSNNDIQKILGESGEEEYEVNLFYEPQFGSLHNINSFQLQTIFASYLNFFFYNLNFNLSNQPMESAIAPEQTYNYVNTYDELNGLIQSEITTIANGETNTGIYKYIYVEL